MPQKTHYDWLWPWVKDLELRTAIDCGGCHGSWTLFWHDKVRQIELFEPNTKALPTLRENLKNIPNVNVYEHALGAKSGKASMAYFKEDHIGTYGITSDVGPYEVKTLDSYNFTDVDIIKIDVEGFEVPLFEGAMGISICFPSRRLDLFSFRSFIHEITLFFFVQYLFIW